jgi:hypothetical protein
MAGCVRVTSGTTVTVGSCLVGVEFPSHRIEMVENRVPMFRAITSTRQGVCDDGQSKMVPVKDSELGLDEWMTLTQGVWDR